MRTHRNMPTVCHSLRNDVARYLSLTSLQLITGYKCLAAGGESNGTEKVSIEQLIFHLTTTHVPDDYFITSTWNEELTVGAEWNKENATWTTRQRTFNNYAALSIPSYSNVSIITSRFTISIRWKSDAIHVLPKGSISWMMVFLTRTLTLTSNPQFNAM